MGVAIYPNTASVIKSLQTGTASSAGTITITAVNTAKTVVHSVSTGSAGTVAATGALSAATGTGSAISFSGAYAYASGYTSSGPGSQTQPILNIASSVSPRYGTTFFAAYPGYASLGSSSNTDATYYINAMNTNASNISLNATNLSGGTTSLTSAAYGATLTNSTTLTVTGPCTYQVIEYY
jgi:hypothetical protein